MALHGGHATRLRVGAEEVTVTCSLDIDPVFERRQNAAVTCDRPGKAPRLGAQCRKREVCQVDGGALVAQPGGKLVESNRSHRRADVTVGYKTRWAVVPARQGCPQRKRAPRRADQRILVIPRLRAALDAARRKCFGSSRDAQTVVGCAGFDQRDRRRAAVQCTRQHACS